MFQAEHSWNLACLKEQRIQLQRPCLTLLEGETVRFLKAEVRQTAQSSRDKIEFLIPRKSGKSPGNFARRSIGIGGETGEIHAKTQQKCCKVIALTALSERSKILP